MMKQRLAVTLPKDTVYVYGTVNGEPSTWTNTAESIWETVAVRTSNDVYDVSLQVYKTSGKYYTAALHLYYGVMSLIFDRTQSDVRRVEYLSKRQWSSMTDDEKAEWRTALKGAYNAEDLNRVGYAVQYIAGRLNEFGYAVDVTPKMDWAMEDIPTPDQLQKYLREVGIIRLALAVLPTTPPLPEDMEGLTYVEANHIERILWDVNLLINNMIAAWFYSGEIYAGEV